MICAAYLAPTQTLLYGALIVAGTVAALVLRLMLPAAQPMLEDACRGVTRGRFWTRFLGITLLLAILLGVVLGFVSGERLPLSGAEPGAPRDCAAMIRLGIRAEAMVLASIAIGVAATSHRIR